MQWLDQPEQIRFNFVFKPNTYGTGQQQGIQSILEFHILLMETYN